MATPSVLAFDAEGRAIDFAVWVDDLQLYLQCDSVDDISLFDFASGAVPAPPADADPTVRSKWATRDAAARLAVRRHLPSSERAHFSQCKTAQALYDAVVARYSSPSTATLSRLMLPYLFLDLAAFPTVADLFTHLRASDTRYRAALPAAFLAENPPPMYITLYFLVTRLPESLRAVRDQFLSVCPTTLTVDLLEKSLLAAEKSIVAVGASRGDPRTPIFEGCSPSPLLPSVASAAPADLVGLESVAGAVAEEVGAAGGLGVAVGVEAGVEVLVAAVEAEVAAEVVAEVAVGAAGARVAVAAVAAEAGVAVVEVVGVARPSGAALGVVSASSSKQQQQQRSREVPAPQQLREWYLQRQRGGAFGPCTYVLRTGDRAGASEAAALGASASVLSGTSESALSGSVSASASHTFTLDSGASRSFFRDRTTLTPLSRRVAVSLADPSGGPVLSRFSTVLPCPAAPSGTLTGLYLPSFSTNLVSGADLQDVGVLQFTPARQRVIHCTEASTGRHLATFTRQPGSSLYTLTTASPPGAESGRVPSSSQVFAAASRSGPESAPWPWPVPVSPVSRGASVLPLTPPSFLRQRLRCRRFTWTCGALPASVDSVTSATSCLVVDDYSRYTTVFPLRSKGDVTEVLIDWIRAARLQLRRSFGSDFPVLRLHSDRGGEYAAHQINLYPRVSRPETSPALLWTGKVGDASAFRVWESRAFVRDLSADKLSPRASPCVFLGFPPDAPRWQFYHPTSRRILSSQDVTFDESVPYYRLFPYRTPSLPPPSLFLVPGPPPVDPLPPQGPAPSGVSQVDAVEPVEVTGDSGAAAGAEPGGAEPGGVQSGGAEPGGAELAGTESGGAEPGGAETGGAEPGGAPPGGSLPERAERGGSPHGGASSRREPLSPQELREWFARRWRRAAGAGGSLAAEGAAAARPGGARAVGTGAAGPAGSPGAGAAEGVGAETTAGGPTGSAPGAAGGSGAARGAAGGAAGAGTPAGGTGAVPAVSGSQSQLQPASPLPAPSPYAGPTGGLTERREPASRPASPVHTARTSGRSSRQRPPPVPGTHRMSLRPSTAPLSAPLPSPPASSLPALADPASDSLRAASPIVTRLLATAVTDPSFENFAASALVTELLDFAARCRLDYAASLVAESESACPPSVGGECALGTDVLEDRQEEFQCLAAASPHLASVLLAPEGDPDALDIPTPRSYAEAIEGPYSSQWQAAMDAEMASWKSTGTYVDAVPPPGANIVSGMWIFRVKRPPGSAPVFKARYVARGFSQRQGVDYFHTFSPTPKMTTLRAPREWHNTLRTTLAALGFAPSTADPSLFLRTDTSLPPFYILVYVDDLVFATADTAGLAYVKSELQKRHTCTDLEHMAAAKRVLRYLCSTSGMGLVLGGRSPVVLTGHADASWADDQATQRSS
ncbi:unnamed protein product [Closterium sp. NIES-65]|nr:unnamed protein product [Closterium sp. NIES-65]